MRYCEATGDAKEEVAPREPTKEEENKAKDTEVVPTKNEGEQVVQAGVAVGVGEQVVEVGVKVLNRKTYLQELPS